MSIFNLLFPNTKTTYMSGRTETGRQFSLIGFFALAAVGSVILAMLKVVFAVAAAIIALILLSLLISIPFIGFINMHRINRSIKRLAIKYINDEDALKKAHGFKLKSVMNIELYLFLVPLALLGAYFYVGAYLIVFSMLPQMNELALMFAEPINTYLQIPLANVLAFSNYQSISRPNGNLLALSIIYYTSFYLIVYFLVMVTLRIWHKIIIKLTLQLDQKSKFTLSKQGRLYGMGGILFAFLIVALGATEYIKQKHQGDTGASQLAEALMTPFTDITKYTMDDFKQITLKQTHESQKTKTSTEDELFVPVSLDDTDHRTEREKEFDNTADNFAISIIKTSILIEGRYEFSFFGDYDEQANRLDQLKIFIQFPNNKQDEMLDTKIASIYKNFAKTFRNLTLADKESYLKDPYLKKNIAGIFKKHLGKDISEFMTVQIVKGKEWA